MDLVGKQFDFLNKRYIVTWNDDTYLRATPLSCKTGMTSEEFLISDITNFI